MLADASLEFQRLILAHKNFEQYAKTGNDSKTPSLCGHEHELRRRERLISKIKVLMRSVIVISHASQNPGRGHDPPTRIG